MKTKGIARYVVALWCLGLPLAPGANAENVAVRTVDIALGKGGILSGQVVNTEGRPLAGETVLLKSNGKEIARCQSGKDGNFQVASLKGGSVEVAAVGVAGNCRLWAPGTAPPAAQTGLLVVAAGDSVRGQHACDSVGCGSTVGCGGVRGHGGGLLGLMIDHPLVTAGAVGAAIAIPLAVSNDESPSSP
jgi:hypothetical protein